MAKQLVQMRLSPGLVERIDMIAHRNAVMREEPSTRTAIIEAALAQWLEGRDEWKECDLHLGAGAVKEAGVWWCGEVGCPNRARRVGG